MSYGYFYILQPVHTLHIRLAEEGYRDFSFIYILFCTYVHYLYSYMYITVLTATKEGLEFTLRVPESNCIWIGTYVIKDQDNN